MKPIYSRYYFVLLAIVVAAGLLGVVTPSGAVH